MKATATTLAPPIPRSATGLCRLGLGFVLTLGLCLSLLMPARALDASEPTPPTMPPEPTGDVTGRIAQLKESFPAGSFFTASGKSCEPNHASGETCSNCTLSSILPAMGYEGMMGIRDGSTCVSFGRYAFWYLFGIADTTSAYQGEAPAGASIIPISQAIPGDLVVLLTPQGQGYHYGIFDRYQPETGDLYLFDANYAKGVISQVGHNSYFRPEVYHKEQSYAVRADGHALDLFTLEKETMTVAVSTTHSLTASQSATWTSTHPQVASVSQTGQVTAHSTGQTLIIVTNAKGETASCRVTVVTAEELPPEENLDDLEDPLNPDEDGDSSTDGLTPEPEVPEEPEPEVPETPDPEAPEPETPEPEVPQPPITPVPPVTPEQPTLDLPVVNTWVAGQYGDVPSGAWYAPAVATVYEYGLMGSTEPGLFSPSMATSRAMLVTVLHAMAGKPDGAV